MVRTAEVGAAGAGRTTRAASAKPASPMQCRWRKSPADPVVRIAGYLLSAIQVHFSPLTFQASPSICEPVIRPLRSENLLLIDM